MRGKWLVLLLFLFFSCESDFFPPGLYDYQVERLLSGGDEKVWDLIINSESCTDDIKLYVALLSSTVDDSVAISNLVPSDDCSSVDTLFIGNADASRFIDQLVFTDTLNFQDGDFWIVQSITSNSLTIESESILRYRSSQ